MAQDNKHNNYYQEEPDFLETLYYNSEYLIKKTTTIIITLSFTALLFMLIFLAPFVIKYEYNQYKGIKQDHPVIFEVNGESYPDLNNLQEFENSGINLDTIPVEDE